DRPGEFKIRDRRRFSPEGETKEARTEAAGEPKVEERPAESREEPPRHEGEAQKEPLPPLDFANFIYSLGSQILFQLGLFATPDSPSERDFEGARRTVDLIVLLQEKTRGNLTDEEQAATREIWLHVISRVANDAFVLLGFAGKPEEKHKKDLHAAREVIDFIAALEEKTRGHLTDQEQKIITETLFQLKMAFVEASK
ncbi:MAG TPA: DUF1844 domain-containing protein, partial [Desulfomonilaceae bacterium]|nr:DUF1844 domain-containing protein [Desulfomonilaceae bacterium]